MSHLTHVSKADTLGDIACAILGNCAAQRCEEDNQVQVLGKCLTKTEM